MEQNWQIDASVRRWPLLLTTTSPPPRALTGNWRRQMKFALFAWPAVMPGMKTILPRTELLPILRNVGMASLVCRLMAGATLSNFNQQESAVNCTSCGIVAGACHPRLLRREQIIAYFNWRAVSRGSAKAKAPGLLTPDERRVRERLVNNTFSV